LSYNLNTGELKMLNEDLQKRLDEIKERMRLHKEKYLEELLEFDKEISQIAWELGQQNDNPEFYYWRI
jgi:hypothetical protein